MRGRSVQKDRWDKYDFLWTAGGHMPLMAFVGELNRRTDEALSSRERKMVQRGWGPESWKRSEHMQRIGKGPPPPKRSQQSTWKQWGQWQESDQAPWQAPWHQGSGHQEGASSWHQGVRLRLAARARHSRKRGSICSIS